MNKEFANSFHIAGHVFRVVFGALRLNLGILALPQSILAKVARWLAGRNGGVGGS